MDGKNKTSADLFGITKRIKAIGNCVVNPADLSAPLEKKWTSQLFCKGCGTLVGVNEEFAILLAKDANQRFPEYPEKFYFETERCGLCDGKGDNIKMFPILRVDA